MECLDKKEEQYNKLVDKAQTLLVVSTIFLLVDNCMIKVFPLVLDSWAVMLSIFGDSLLLVFYWRELRYCLRGSTNKFKLNSRQFGYLVWICATTIGLTVFALGYTVGVRIVFSRANFRHYYFKEKTFFVLSIVGMMLYFVLNLLLLTAIVKNSLNLRGAISAMNFSYMHANLQNLKSPSMGHNLEILDESVNKNEEDKI